MPIISLLIFSSKFTLQYLLHDSALDSSNISPFQGAWREALSAKETEGIMQKSGASFLGSGAAFGFVWLPLQGPLMVCVWRDIWWPPPELCIHTHSRSVTLLPWSDPSDHLATAPSMYFRPCTHSRIPTPFYTDLPVLASLFRELFPNSGQLMTSSDPENFSAIVGCNHNFFNKV